MGGAPGLVALNGAYQITFAVGAVFATAAALLSAVLLRAGQQAPAQEAVEAASS